MTATSASSHRQYFTKMGYSALHNSDKCFPEFKKKLTLYFFKNGDNYIKKTSYQIL